MSKTTVILVRHGETLWNKELRYQGQQDSPLSPKGLQQAEVVGSFLQNRSIDAVYSSDLKRALLTAESIAKHHQLTPIVDQRLREIAFGVWEGKTRTEVQEEYPEVWEARIRDVLTTRISGGELPSEVLERLHSFLNALLSDCRGQTIAVVSHGGALRLLIASLLQMPLEKAHCIHQSNTGISELIHYEDGERCWWEAACINSTGHLGSYFL
ncbi:MAG: histidine phosphatase family protein [Bacillota bacterium]|jgi:alpha-ribazole phosphatase|nr:histidine phosphatase family protein [Bacillota bacterium]NLJ03921.1 histidine phosphatase family protein [Bacillota bacterium]